MGRFVKEGYCPSQEFYGDEITVGTLVLYSLIERSIPVEIKPDTHQYEMITGRLVIQLVLARQGETTIPTE